MSEPDDSESKDAEREDGRVDRAEVLRRRAAFVARALGGLALPALVGGCGDPQPCLNIAQPRELVPTASAPVESGAPSPTSSSSSSPSAPTPEGTFAISPEEAQKLGLPAFGFRATMKRGGWSVAGPSKDQYVQASGAPGGPLTFSAKPYNDGVSDPAALEVLFKKVLSDWSGLDPIHVGPAETVTLGGKKLEAQAFRTGKSLATTNWCVIKAPAGPGSRTGVLFLFGTGIGESTKPTCKTTLDHEAIAEIVGSLTFME